MAVYLHTRSHNRFFFDINKINCVIIMNEKSFIHCNI